MTKIKLCGLSRPEDIQAANELEAEYIGFVFAPQSKRCVSLGRARELKGLLNHNTKAVGVFVDEHPKVVAALLNSGVIDAAQLHGSEDEEYIACLRQMTDQPIIKAFVIRTHEDVRWAEESTADKILLDAGAGNGTAFDWELIQRMKRPYLLAGGLSPENVGEAVEMLHPYAVDVSSGIETQGAKDEEKMAAFVAAVRKEDKL